MKRAGLLALMTALLLCGCAEQTQRRESLEERQLLFSESGISFDAEISADLGDEVFRCSLECTGTGEEAELLIVEPELVSGVKARIASGDASLEYEGLELALGELSRGSMGPMQAAAALVMAMCSTHIDGFFEEAGGELLGAQLYVDEDSYALVWYEAETLSPVHAELVCEGRAVISCEIDNFIAGTAATKEG